MLSKLLKYDFKALRRILAPMLLCVLGLAILSSVSLTLLLRWDNHSENYFGTVIGTVITSFVVLVIIASVVVAGVIILVNFYRSFISTEAYLTFTLPVSIKDHMLSKIISGYVWLMLSGIVTVFSLFIIVVFGTASSGFVNSDILSTLYEIFKFIFIGWDYNYTLMFIMIVCIIFIAPMTLLLQYYAAIVIGGVIAKKNKLLAAIGFVFLIDFIVQLFYQILYIITLSINFNVDFYNDFGGVISNLNISLAFYIVVFVGLGIGFFITSKRLLENKLNLE